MAQSLREFPFTDDFEQLLDGRVTYARLSVLACALEAIIDKLVILGNADIQHAGKIVPAVLYAMAARARVSVAYAYEEEVMRYIDYGKAQVLSALHEEWDAMIKRDRLERPLCVDSTVALLAPVVQTAWQYGAVREPYTAEELIRAYGSLVEDVRVVEVGDVLIAGDKGKIMVETTPLVQCKPVLPIDHYRYLLQRRHEMDGVDSPWDFLLNTGTKPVAGSCYQYLFHPKHRQAVCDELQTFPMGSVVLRAWLHRYSDERSWTDVPAVVDTTSEVVHVLTAGSLSDVAAFPVDRRIGGEPAGAEHQVDYFARALVDDFVSRHKRKDSAVNVPPVDAQFGALSLSTPGAVRRNGFQEVASQQYALIGETVSPQLRQHGFSAVAGDSMVVSSERDGARLAELCNRLDSGAVVSEDYHERTRSRFSLGRRRPSIQAGVGHVFHVFAGFPAEEGGAGMGVWMKDKAWSVPGWVSYLAQFKPGASYTLAFASELRADDIRIDCTGDGDMYLGQCMFPVDSTVLWFTDSIRMELRARSFTTLRISVPDSGSALAIGNTMRRYMYLPGYTIAAKRFSVVPNRDTTAVRLKRESRSGIQAGCQLYAGTLELGSGRHRLRLTGLVSSQPVKLLVKADPVESLVYVGVCGVRVEPRTRDYSSVLFDTRDGDVSVNLRRVARVQFSVLQIVDTAEFDNGIRGMVTGSSF